MMGMVAYSNRQAISNLHMSVKSGSSTEVAKSMSHTASNASILKAKSERKDVKRCLKMFFLGSHMTLAAFRSPWARPWTLLDCFICTRPQANQGTELRASLQDLRLCSLL